VTASGRGADRDVVVGVDGSDHARLALKWAADEARLRGSGLRVLFASDRRPKGLPGWYEEGDGAEAAHRSAGEAVVEDAVGLVATRHPGMAVHGETVEGTGASVLVDASDDADLLVVGARGSGGFAGLLLGSVSHQCIHHAHCPVAVVHASTDDPAPRRSGGRIVVGFDGSAGAELALDWALGEARVRDATVEAVFAWQYPPVGSYLTGPSTAHEADARRITDAAAARAARSEPSVPFEARSAVDATVPVLVDGSDGADLLVVGARGHGAFRDLLLGSIAQQCANHARCPAVVVREGRDEAELAVPA
jgi:nucleotide-binding universal stress UspA family protein